MHTNRGRIITPLKDRFGAQIRTHYPLDIVAELAVVRQEAMAPAGGEIAVKVPNFMADIIATFSHLARQSPNVNQRSGVSVRLSVSNYETLIAAAIRRALRAGEKQAVPRVTDLDALMASTQGKIEIETLDEREGSVVEKLLKAAVLNVFKDRCRIEDFREAINAFEEGLIVHVGDDLKAAEYVALLSSNRALATAVDKLDPGTTPGELASATEFVLEGLHLSKRLNKDASGSKATYRGR